MPNRTLNEGIHVSDNERFILDVIRREGSISQSRVGQLSHLTQQSTHRIISALLARDLLQAGPPASGAGRGKPSPSLQLAARTVFSVGIAINTDCAILTLTALDCELVEEVRFRFPPLSRQTTLERLSTALDRICVRNGVDKASLIGVGFSINGYFVANRRQINAPEPLRDWSLIDLQPLLEETFDLPVWIENSVSAAAVGESLCGAGRWARSFVYLGFNYGFGGGLVIEGKPFFGANGNAGELSSILTREEQEVRPALRYLLEMLQEQGVDVDSIEDISLRFDPRWPGVDAWIDRVMPCLNRIINSLSGILDPQAIVFGGQLPVALGEALMARVEYWGGDRYGITATRPSLVMGQQSCDAAARGAALIPLRACFFL
ncbi:ROK family transcriptional regulator [Pseudomonas viridiflava]|uniref:ROK family transcriptional regulator n=1 Tax=Pseudomonas viridiflava TaxID=33069 RepID=UPI000F050141|nr:ROK family protein [Pseudomonas viridiflava]